MGYGKPEGLGDALTPEHMVQMLWLWLMGPGEEEVGLEDPTWGGRMDQRHGASFPGLHSL